MLQSPELATCLLFFLSESVQDESAGEGVDPDQDEGLRHEADDSSNSSPVGNLLKFYLVIGGFKNAVEQFGQSLRSYIAVAKVRIHNI